MRGTIFTSIISPLLIKGVVPSFAFLLLLLFFLAVIFIRPLFGNEVMCLALLLIFCFYYIAVKKSRKDPYWWNVFLMSLTAERRDPIAFLSNLFFKKKKKIYR